MRPLECRPDKSGEYCACSSEPGGANEAAASGASPVIIRTSRVRNQLSREQRGGTSPGTSPQGAQVRNPDDQSLSSRPATPTTPGKSSFDWAPIDTDSWEKFEDTAQKATQGIAKKARNEEVSSSNWRTREPHPLLWHPTPRRLPHSTPRTLKPESASYNRNVNNSMGEREALCKQVLELQTVNTELSRDLEQANLAIDICLPCVRAPPGAPVTLDKSMLALVTSLGKRPMRQPQMSAPPLLTILRGPLPSALDTPTSQLIPVMSTPMGRPPSEQPLQSLTTFSRSTPQASASLAAPPSQEYDWEAEMDSVPQPGPESQQ